MNKLLKLKEIITKKAAEPKKIIIAKKERPAYVDTSVFMYAGTPYRLW